MPQFADDHVKTVGTEIDGGNYFRRSLLLELYAYLICGDGTGLNGLVSRSISSLSGLLRRGIRRGAVWRNI
jgi:hypothetical protein